jgi:hypothetical protein
MDVEILDLGSRERHERKYLRIGRDGSSSWSVFSAETTNISKYDGRLFRIDCVQHSFVTNIVLRDEGDLAAQQIIQFSHSS